MALPFHIGIVSLSADATPADVSRVSAAIQKQVVRDFGPIWDVSATVDAFAKLTDLPIGYWPVMIVDDDPNLPASAGGIHLDSQNQPFALVRAVQGWGMATSHEVLEMLADPMGNRVIAGESPAEGQDRVEFLVEVCDPSEAAEHGYTINGLFMSDFYTPHYFDPVTSPGVRYSFQGAITEPRQVLPGGYLSWRDPTTNEWFQLQYFDADPQIVKLPPLEDSGSLRASIERISNAKSMERMFKDKKPLVAAQEHYDNVVAKSCAARAKELMKEIESLYVGANGGSTGEAARMNIRKPRKR